MSETAACVACGHAVATRAFETTERLLGLGDRFTYTECAACGTLQLADPPADYGRYYPAAYRRFVGASGINSTRRALGRRDAAVLDVGCGSEGHLLRILRAQYGWTGRLVGVDPFAEAPSALMARYVPDLLPTVIRGVINDVDEDFDLVCFHHSLEHVADPLATLRAARARLRRDGRCLVRLPVLAEAWDRYGADWVALDPPRHLWVPTLAGLTHLAERAGFDVAGVEYDSTGFGFWGSELYRRGQRLLGANPLRVFGAAQLTAWERLAVDLNAEGRGDTVSVALRVRV